jgi:hypothetical protein
MTATGTAQPGATSRAQYLAEVAALLWPPPASLTIGRGTGATKPAADGQYLIVPNAQQPRLIVPRPGAVAAAAIAGFNPDRSRRAAVLSGILRIALRAGAADRVLRDRLTVAGSADTFQRYLAEVLGQDVLISVLLGPPRANAKPIAQLLSPAGDVLGYAKVGVSQLSRRLVRAETATLKLLASASTHAVTIPRIRHEGRWQDADILLLDPLRADGRPPRRGSDAMRRAAVAEIAAIAGTHAAPLLASPYWPRLQSSLTALGQRGTGFAGLAARIGELAGPAPLTFGSWHGDWTRTNVTVRGTTVLAWDWERFETGVPVGFDALHYHLHHAINVEHRSPATAVSDLFGCADDLAGSSVTGSTAQPGALVCALYLLQLATRYLQDRQDLAGARLGQPDRWMLPALTTAVEAWL